jgi:hypothetical protein
VSVDVKSWLQNEPETDSLSKLDELVGRQLSSVEFVRDYVQLRFDGPCLSAFNLPSIRQGTTLVQAADSGFQDGLCSQIGIEVENVSISDGQLILNFVNGVAFLVSLRDEDYTPARRPSTMLAATELGW